MKARYTVGRRVWLCSGLIWTEGRIVEIDRAALTIETSQRQRVYVSHVVARIVLRLSKPKSTADNGEWHPDGEATS